MLPKYCDFHTFPGQKIVTRIVYGNFKKRYFYNIGIQGFKIFSLIKHSSFKKYFIEIREALVMQEKNWK